MTTRKSGFYILLLLMFSFLFWGYQIHNVPVEEVQKEYLQGFEHFYNSTIQLKEAAVNLEQSNNSLHDLQVSFAITRESFKQVEFIIDYLQPQDVKDYLNGAPLLKTERAVPRVIIMQPKGMQVLEELIYADNPFDKKGQIISLSKELQSQSFLILNYQKRQPLFDRQVFEAVRLGLIRIMAMGVTGFDTPASGMALDESKVAFHALFKAMEPYIRLCQTDTLKSEVFTLFQEADNWLTRQDDFEKFDHSLFIRDYIDPLFGAVKDLQNDLHIETMEEVLYGESVFNYQADHIFSDDFLNPYYYTVLYREMDSPELTELGRMLFFDPILSQNMKRSCSSCHNPDKAFSDGMVKSMAYDENGDVGRNSPGLVNAIYSEKFFLDLRADKMENQIEHVIFNQKEFHTNYKTIFSRLEKSEEYQSLFESAFAGQSVSGINRYTLSAAISSYILSLRSFNSPVDKYLRGETDEIDPKVKKGFNLFMGKAACGTCHFAPTFSGLVPPFFEENESEVIGVLVRPGSDSIDTDQGRYTSGRLSDEAQFYKQSFKTTTVRNVALTAPYFHNGAYSNLKEVLDFYNHGGAQGKGLDLPNQTLPGDSLGLDEYEINAIVKFLESLSDTTGLTKRPKRLPLFSISEWNSRSVGGEY